MQIVLPQTVKINEIKVWVLLYPCYFDISIVYVPLFYKQLLKGLQLYTSKIIVQQYKKKKKKSSFSKTRKPKPQQPPLTCCIITPQETVVLKGRINWSFNFSLFIVREKITEVLPWGEQQLKVRPDSFYPRGKKIGNLLN